MRSDKRDMFAARRRINKELDGEGVLLSDSMNLERETALYREARRYSWRRCNRIYRKDFGDGKKKTNSDWYLKL